MFVTVLLLQNLPPSSVNKVPYLCLLDFPSGNTKSHNYLTESNSAKFDFQSELSRP